MSKSQWNWQSNRRSCTWSVHQVKGKRKAANCPDSSVKRRRNGHGCLKPLRYYSNTSRAQNQMPLQPRWLRSWSVGHVHWSLPGLCCRFFTRFWAWSLPRSWVTTQRYGQQRVEVLQKKLRRGEAKIQTWISTDKGKSKECKTRLPSQLTTAPGAAVIKWCKMYLQFIIWYVGRFLFYDITVFPHSRWRWWNPRIISYHFWSWG